MRVALLVVFAAGLPSLALPELLVVVALLGGGLFLLGREAAARLVAMVARLRWLFAALLILYLGFTPGEPLIAALPGLSREGFLEAVRRGLVLVAVIAAVLALLQSTPPTVLAQALAWMLRPFDRLGADSRRFGIRLSLALAAATGTRASLQRSKDGNWIDQAVEAVLSAERVAPTPVPSPEPEWDLPPPPLWQWLLPLLLALALALHP